MSGEFFVPPDGAMATIARVSQEAVCPEAFHEACSWVPVGRYASLSLRIALMPSLVSYLTQLVSKRLLLAPFVWSQPLPFSVRESLPHCHLPGGIICVSVTHDNEMQGLTTKPWIMFGRAKLEMRHCNDAELRQIANDASAQAICKECARLRFASAVSKGSISIYYGRGFCIVYSCSLPCHHIPIGSAAGKNMTSTP
jgi:hypothetical protein